MRPPQHWTNLVPRNALTLLQQSGSRRVPAKTMREVAVLFVDIEGCTRLSEELPPREVNEVRETYFSEYLDIVRAESGEVTLPIEESRPPVAEVKTGEPAGDIMIERPGTAVNTPFVTRPGGGR